MMVLSSIAASEQQRSIRTAAQPPLGSRMATTTTPPAATAAVAQQGPADQPPVRPYRGAKVHNNHHQPPRKPTQATDLSAGHCASSSSSSNQKKHVPDAAVDNDVAINLISMSQQTVEAESVPPVAMILETAVVATSGNDDDDHQEENDDASSCCSSLTGSGRFTTSTSQSVDSGGASSAYSSYYSSDGSTSLGAFSNLQQKLQEEQFSRSFSSLPTFADHNKRNEFSSSASTSNLSRTSSAPTFASPKLPTKTQKNPLEDLVTPFTEIVSRLVKTHRHMARYHHHTFVGTEAVSAIVRAGLAPTRPQAVHLGRELMEQFQLFQHVYDEHCFKDQALFYRFQRDATAEHTSSLSRSATSVSSSTTATLNGSTTVRKSGTSGRRLRRQRPRLARQARPQQRRRSSSSRQSWSQSSSSETLDFEGCGGSSSLYSLEGEEDSDSTDIFRRMDISVIHEEHNSSGSSHSNKKPTSAQAKSSRKKEEGHDHSDSSSWLSCTDAEEDDDLSSTKKFRKQHPGGASEEESTTLDQLQQPKNVSFGRVQVIEFERCIGDNPSVSAGVPIALGPRAVRRVVYNSLDHYYESYQRPRQVSRPKGLNLTTTPTRHFKLSRQLREQLLLEYGYKRSEIIAAVRVARTLRQRRQQSYHNQHLDGVHERVERVVKSKKSRASAVLWLPQRWASFSHDPNNNQSLKAGGGNTRDAPLSPPGRRHNLNSSHSSSTSSSSVGAPSLSVSGRPNTEYSASSHTELVQIAAVLCEKIELTDADVASNHVRRSGKRTKKNKKRFIASKAVDCMLELKLAETREEAVQLASELESTLGLFQHVHGSGGAPNGFQDQPWLLYRFNEGILQSLGISDYLSQADTDSAASRSAKSSSSDSSPGTSGVVEEIQVLPLTKIDPKDPSSTHGHDSLGSLSLSSITTNNTAISTPFLAAKPLRPSLKNRNQDAGSGTGNHSGGASLYTQDQLVSVASILQERVKVQDRRYHLKSYHNCFIGYEAVDCILAQRKVLVSSRNEAVLLLRELELRLCLFEHVCKNHPLKDEYLFYKFTRQIHHHTQGSSGTAVGGQLENRLIEQNDEDGERPSISPRDVSGAHNLEFRGTQPQHEQGDKKEEFEVQSPFQMESLRDELIKTMSCTTPAVTASMRTSSTRTTATATLSSVPQAQDAVASQTPPTPPAQRWAAAPTAASLPPRQGSRRPSKHYSVLLSQSQHSCSSHGVDSIEEETSLADDDDDSVAVDEGENSDTESFAIDNTEEGTRTSKPGKNDGLTASSGALNNPDLSDEGDDC